MTFFLDAIVYPLLDADTRSLVSVLFWGNIVSAALILSFRATTPSSRDRLHPRYFIAAKVLQAAAWLLLFFRGQLPDLLSVNLGNTCLFLGFYCEARTVLLIIQADSRAVRLACTGITASCVLLFNVAEMIRPGDPSFRVMVASLCLFLTLAVPTERLLRLPDFSNFKKIIGVFYLIHMAMLLPRAVTAIVSPFDVLSNTLIQTLTHLSLVMLLVFSLAAYLLLLKEETDKALHEMSTKDPLTGLPNRDTFFASARFLFSRHIDGTAPISLIAFDLNDFRNVNNVWSNNFGDFFIKSFAAALSETIRSTDIPCRFRDEQFLVLLPETNAETAQQIGEQVSLRMKKRFMQQETGIIFTLSGGIASSAPKRGDTLEEYIRRAYVALHTATTTGKDKIVLW